MSRFFGDDEKSFGIPADSYVSENVKIGDNVTVGHNCSIHGDIVIGEGTIIEDNVVIMNRVKIGRNCIIHSGSVIGKDGFGFSYDNQGVPHKVQHFGGVRIECNVEIGAGAVIDRGTIDDTVIGEHTKIDSRSLIAHNCVIGSRNLIIGASVGGSCRIGNDCYLAPGAVIKNQVAISNNSFIGMGVCVNKNLDDNECMLPGNKSAVTLKDYKRFL